jgi:hypothetical protein
LPQFLECHDRPLAQSIRQGMWACPDFMDT